MPLTEAEAQARWGTKGCHCTITFRVVDKRTRWARFKQWLREIREPFDVWL